MDDNVLVNDLNWNLKHPCADCPFLKSSPYHAGVASSLPAYHESIQSGTFGHTCHKTDNRSDCDGPHTYQGDTPQHCIGAAMMLLKTGNGVDLQVPLLNAAQCGDIDLTLLTAQSRADKNVFTFPGMLRFYAAKLQELLRTPRARAQQRKQRRKK